MTNAEWLFSVRSVMSKSTPFIPPPPSKSFTYVVNVDRRMLNKIMYAVDKIDMAR